MRRFAAGDEYFYCVICAHSFSEYCISYEEGTMDAMSGRYFARDMATQVAGALR
jgi:hypothetical protein